VSDEGRRRLILPDDFATVRAFTPWNGMTERPVDRRFASFTRALLAGALAALASLAPAAAQSPAPDLPSTLTEAERPTIALFERVSPSVVGAVSGICQPPEGSDCPSVALADRNTLKRHPFEGHNSKRCLLSGHHPARFRSLAWLQKDVRASAAIGHQNRYIFIERSGLCWFPHISNCLHRGESLFSGINAFGGGLLQHRQAAPLHAEAAEDDDGRHVGPSCTRLAYVCPNTR
jgi:hypothetical protein